MSTLNTGSLYSFPELDNLVSSTSEEKKATTINHLSFVLGSLYGIFVGMIGLLVCLFNPKINNQDLSDWLMLYLLTISLVFICALIVDIKRYTRQIDKYSSEKGGQFEMDNLNHAGLNGHRGMMNNHNNHNENGEISTLQQNSENDYYNVEHKYCYISGRHTVSAYLKLGVAAFALGHLVHMILIMVIEMSVANMSCLSIVYFIAQGLYPVYSFIQLFFVFKYSNIVIVKYNTIASLGFLHLVASNICFWLLSVSNETQLALKAYKLTSLNNTSSDGTVPQDDTCRPPTLVLKIFEQYASYLYPFSVEYHIIIVGIFYMVWSNIGNCKHNDKESLKQFLESEDVSTPHSFTMNISCHRSSSGIFASIITMILLISFIVLGFVFGNTGLSYLLETVEVMTSSIQLFFHSVMLVTTIIAFNKIRKFDVNKQHVPLMDDVLLFLCAPAFFAETLFTVVATMYYLNVVRFLDTIMMTLQMIVQLVFVFDGQRRCSNSRKLFRCKPGRQLVLFLLIANVALWLMYTFKYKSSRSTDERYLYYGKETWVMIGHMCLPLIMFFRFHSSVCIADIWTHTFLPGVEEH